MCMNQRAPSEELSLGRISSGASSGGQSLCQILLRCRLPGRRSQSEASGEVSLRGFYMTQP